MKNELNTLKAQSRKTYFDFSPNTQYRTQYASGYGEGFANPYATSQKNTQANSQANFQAKAAKNESDPKKPAAEPNNDKPHPLTDGFYAMS